MCLFFLRHLLHLVGWLHAPSECCVHAEACVICCIAWCTANQRRVLLWARRGGRSHSLFMLPLDEVDFGEHVNVREFKLHHECQG